MHGARAANAILAFKGADQRLPSALGVSPPRPRHLKKRIMMIKFLKSRAKRKKIRAFTTIDISNSIQAGRWCYSAPLVDQTSLPSETRVLSSRLVEPCKA